MKHCTSYSCIRPEVRKIKLDPLAIELRATSELSDFATGEDVPSTRNGGAEVLVVGLASIVVGVKVAKVLQLGQARALVALNVWAESSWNTVPAARRAGRIRKDCSLGEAVKSSPKSDCSKSDPERDVEAESTGCARHRHRDGLLDGGSNCRVLDEITHHLYPADYIERSPWIPIGHPIACRKRFFGPPRCPPNDSVQLPAQAVHSDA